MILTVDRFNPGESSTTGSGNKLIMYWKEEGCSPVAITDDKREFYWSKEIKRLKVALQSEVARRECVTDELEEEIKKTDAILKYADAMINRGRQNV